MNEPHASRPYMPGYGTQAPDEGTGLLPWSWAEERLASPRNYWLISVCPDGSPHAMPVWGIWDGGAFWFSSSKGSRKARNLTADPRCTVASEDARDPVIMEGIAELITDLDALERLLALVNAKYQTEYTMELMDPSVNAVFCVQPRRVFGLLQEDFTGSPTRWTFQE